LKLAQETYNQVVEELKPIEEKIDKIMHELEAINQVTIELGKVSRKYVIKNELKFFSV